ncbi:oligosaccharide flippase family protein [Alteraurantiacibacter aquimixticola]|uniref:oligosaccharide flippase family protein n=1 Tax=Alteraurantiacibacter aquimixticola TaxID=2489173 RepID=UPI00145A2C53|nr:oligosaccharide flippase family protein [Alteraurantiacibacter aquimixticola]
MIAALRELQARFPGLASIGRNAAHFVTGEWAEVLLRAIYAIAISRFLGPSDYGWWSYAFSVSAICINFAAMGSELLLPERIGKDREAALPFIETSFAVRLLLLSAFGVLMAGYALFGATETMERLALLVLLPTVLFRGISNWLRLAAIGFEQASLAMRPMVMVRAAELVLGIGLVLTGANLLTLLALHGLSWLVEVAIIMPRIRKLALLQLRIRRSELSDVVRKGAIIGVASGLTFLLFAAPLILLKHYSGDIAAVGQFGLAMQLSMFAVMALQGVLTAAQSVLSRAVAREDERARYFGLLFLLGCIVLAVPAWFGARWLGVPVVTWLLGEQYRMAGELLPICLMLAISVLMANGYWQLLVIHGRIAAGAVVNLLSVLLLAGTAASMIAEYGAAGAAYAAILAGLLRSVLLVIAGTLSGRQKST